MSIIHLRFHALHPGNNSVVYSLGTESRRPPAEYIPPQDTPYDFILFRAQEVKDLNVETQPLPVPQQRNVRDDPAIIGVSVYHPVALVCISRGSKRAARFQAQNFVYQLRM